jgi:[ribosomal protein S18]-alanine N-acetyltransferase
MIRNAIIEDLDKIELLEKEFGAEAFKRRSLRHLILSDNMFYVIDLGGVLVGSIIGLKRKDTLSVRLYSLMIHPDHRNKGYAIELIEFFIRRCRELGASGVGLEVAEGNYPAISLYGSLGFQMTGRVDQYYRDGSSALKFFKKI